MIGRAQAKAKLVSAHFLMNGLRTAKQPLVDASKTSTTEKIRCVTEFVT